jgi:hypothetical protein
MSGRGALPTRVWGERPAANAALRRHGLLAKL